MLTSLGVLAGLVAVGLTGLTILDPIIALAVAVVIFWTGIGIGWTSTKGLMDPRLEGTEEAELVKVMESEPLVLEVRGLHTGRPGSYRRIDARIAMCRHLSVGEAHDACDGVEAAILKRFPQSWIALHVEPCSSESNDCGGRCLSTDGRMGGKRPSSETEVSKEAG